MLTEEIIKAKTVTISRKEYEQLKKKASAYCYYKDNFIELSEVHKEVLAENEKLKRIVEAEHDEKQLMIAERFDFIINEVELINDRKEFHTTESRSGLKIDSKWDLHHQIEFMRTLMPNDDLDDYMNYIFIRHVYGSDNMRCPDCKVKLTVYSEYPTVTFRMTGEKAVLTDEIFFGFCCKKCGNKYPNLYEGYKRKNSVISERVVTADTIAQLITYKFTEKYSLYNQEIFWNDLDVKISCHTMARWVKETYEKWLLPLYNMFREELIKSEFIYSGVTDIRKYSLGKNNLSINKENSVYMWLYRTSSYADKKIILFEVTKECTNTYPLKFLKGYKGIIQTKRLEYYNGISEKVGFAALWEKVRELFEEALEILTPPARKGSYAEEGLKMCDEIIGYENNFGNVDKDVKLQLRNAKCKPVIDKLIEWAHDFDRQKKDPGKIGYTGKAFYYIIEHEDELKCCLRNAEAEFTDESCRTACLPFTKEEKAFKIIETDSGYDMGMVMYSIMQTITENHLNPVRYLSYYLMNISNLGENQDPHDLLPWNAPDECREIHEF